MDYEINYLPYDHIFLLLAKKIKPNTIKIFPISPWSSIAFDLKKKYLILPNVIEFVESKQKFFGM